jgi:hypothetical protein
MVFSSQPHILRHIGDGFEVIHMYCAMRYNKSALKVLKMSTENRFFKRADGPVSPILRPKDNETEDQAIERLQKIGWDISKGSYHVVDGDNGKSYHKGASADSCKICLRRENSASKAPVADVPPKKKRGRPKKVKEEE